MKCTRTAGGTTFGYETHGEGTPVIFLHGMPTDRRSMVPRFEPLFAKEDAPRGFRRIYVDLPGLGETPASPTITNTDEFVEAITRFMEEESAGERFALVGTSWGAHISLAYTTFHADRLAGLAMFVPGHGPGYQAVRPPRTVLVSEPGLLEGVPKPLADALGAAATVHTRAVLEAISNTVAPGGQSADQAFLGTVLKERLTYRDRLSKASFDGPVLIATGRQDSMCGYADAWLTAEQFPRATYAVLDRAGHAMQIEQNKLLQALFREWLARVREGLGGAYEA